MKFQEFLDELEIDNIGFKDWIDLEDSLIETLSSFKDKIVIWGASKGGEEVLNFLLKHNIEPIYFVDSDTKKHGKKLKGIKIVPPSSLERGLVVVIGTVFQDEIVPYLENRKIKYISNIFSVLHKNSCVKKNFSILNDNLDKLYEVYTLLSDNESKKTYIAYLKYLLSRSPLHIKKSNYPQYFHPSVRPEEEDIIVDGGAFVGDTVLKFINNVPNIKRIYAIEPDEQNFQKLIKACNSYKNLVIPIHAALWKDSGILKFSDGLGLGSYVTERGTTKVKCISLDRFFKNRQPPTLIKLDVEGAEKEVILGGKNLIVNYKPKLQISIYHDPLHLFEIPLLIKELNPSYNLYIGHHTGEIAELVLYCN